MLRHAPKLLCSILNIIHFDFKISAILVNWNFLVGFVFFALLDIRFPKTHEKNLTELRDYMQNQKYLSKVYTYPKSS